MSDLEINTLGVEVSDFNVRLLVFYQKISELFSDDVLGEGSSFSEDTSSDDFSLSVGRGRETWVIDFEGGTADTCSEDPMATIVYIKDHGFSSGMSRSHCSVIGNLTFIVETIRSN